ncbi:MAG: hypothetical protein HYX76_15645 [Acidobacteria bacterium]|nr:hypothetical protein [Acidobacteriota bacterium]
MLWLILAFVVWNVVFDGYVRRARFEYLARQALHAQGRAPEAVTIDAVMRPAIAQGVRRATMWAGGVALAGWALTTCACRRPKRSDPGNCRG